MRIPFLSKILARNSDKQKPGTPRSVHHLPKEIAYSLKKYADANTLVEGEIAPESKNAIKFTTGIINIDTTRRNIIFDAVSPENLNSQFTPGTLVKFTLSHLGIRTQFECTFQESMTSPRYEHLFSFPEGIEHIQLRDAFRIHISTVNPVKITLDDQEKGSYSGNVTDLSVTGARITLKKLIQPKPHRGDLYENCYLTLSDGQRLISSAQLMHWQYDPGRDETVLGVKFTLMDASTERNLNRFLTDLQRKERNMDV